MNKSHKGPEGIRRQGREGLESEALFRGNALLILRAWHRVPRASSGNPGPLSQEHLGEKGSPEERRMETEKWKSWG